jgi:hypothetical protein
MDIVGELLRNADARSFIRPRRLTSVKLNAQPHIAFVSANHSNALSFQENAVFIYTNLKDGLVNSVRSRFFDLCVRHFCTA